MLNEVSTEEIDARIRALCEQRNDAQDKVVVLVGKLTVALNRIEELEKQKDKPTVDAP